MKIIRALLALAAALVFLAVPKPSSDYHAKYSIVTRSYANSSCPAVSGAICVYDLPVDVQNAQQACFRLERVARGIPGEIGAYLAWMDAHRGTAVALDWRRAHTACRHVHTQPGGLWNWSGLVFVRVIP